MTELFDILKASLFTGDDVQIHDWKSVFAEMKEQAVAALPGEWLKTHSVDSSWNKYCFLQQGQWVRVMHAQSQLLDLLEESNIPSVIIKGAAAAMYYPHPNLRSMGDVDVLVKRKDLDRAAELLEANGYTLTHNKDHVGHHYNYSKDIKEVLEKEKPDVVLVHGDTSTTFVTALACFYLQIPVGHVEAGLRTYNIYSPYPEEFNREAVSIVSQFNFAPTTLARQNLLNEGRRLKTSTLPGIPLLMLCSTP